MMNMNKNLELFEEGLQDFAMEEHMRYSSNPNNLSYWFPYIKDIKSLKIPQTVIVPTPVDVIAALWSEKFNKPGAIRDLIVKHVEEKIIPCMEPSVKYFVKNGTYSNKFQFNQCVTDIEHVLDSFININYDSLIVGAGGVSEFVIREYIPTKMDTKTIYNGMPLLPEFRCFWHPGKKEVSTVVDYWLYNEVKDRLYDENDKKVFEESNQHRMSLYLEHMPIVIQKINEAFSGRKLPTDEPWSIDVLFNGEYYWLIDMARKEDSFYAEYDS